MISAKEKVGVRTRWIATEIKKTSTTNALDDVSMLRASFIEQGLFLEQFQDALHGIRRPEDVEEVKRTGAGQIHVQLPADDPFDAGGERTGARLVRHRQ